MQVLLTLVLNEAERVLWASLDTRRQIEVMEVTRLAKELLGPISS